MMLEDVIEESRTYIDTYLTKKEKDRLQKEQEEETKRI